MEKDFERYEILVMYGQITSRHNYCKFTYCKHYVKITVLSELQHKYYAVKLKRIYELP